VHGLWHDNRHTLITELAESGACDQTIMDIAGQISRQMLKHYSHIRMQAKRNALERVLRQGARVQKWVQSVRRGRLLELGLFAIVLADSRRKELNTRAPELLFFGAGTSSNATLVLVDRNDDHEHSFFQTDSNPSRRGWEST
jgi:hypothetical protein